MSDRKQKNIFITWHYTTHGIAYFKHILSAFYSEEVSIDNLNTKDISQDDMNVVFDEYNRGFLFDKVYYLTAPQETFDNISARRFNYKDQILRKDDFIKKSGTLKIWKAIREWNLEDIEKEIVRVKEKFTKEEYKLWKSQIWRDIQHYKISDQLLWFKKHSNSHPNYKSKEFFEIKKFNIKNLRDASEISKELHPFIYELKKEFPDANFIINAVLGSNETQVVWQIFSELNLLPRNSKLIRTYDNKRSNKNKRFKNFNIEEIPSKIISEVVSNIKLYGEKPKSKVRRLAELKMQQYIRSGFTILILGERGIGKTRLAEKYSSNKKVVSINCASFTNNLIAESILFGHKKGAFTDAKEDKKGVFEEADNGILFLDEIHHLDKEIQAKLMKAMQTDDENRFTIRRLGENKEKKVSLTIILASNVSIQELHKKLLPDFYDRITQLVIEIPPLRESPEDLHDEFKKIWIQMKFELFYPFETIVQKDEKLIKWIKNLNLFGNYRDLQKIAIYYKTFLDFNNALKDLLGINNPFEFTIQEYNKYISFNEKNQGIESFFSKEKSTKEMENCFKAQLAEWAIKIFSGAPNAAKHFKSLGDKTTKETLYKWRKLCKKYQE